MSPHPLATIGGELLDGFLPRPRREEIDLVDVAAAPDEVYRALRSFDLGRLPLVRTLRRLQADFAPERPPLGHWRDLAEAVVDASGIVLDLATPFLRRRRNHWGLEPERAALDYPGDPLVPAPAWQWTHGVTIAAAPAEVWPWVAQLGADRAGFYSYQLLENLAGCGLRNSDQLRPEWRLRPGDALQMHPRVPSLFVDTVEDERWLVARSGEDPDAPVQASWLFFLEPIGATHCRLISRFRVGYDRRNLRARLLYGPYLTESIGFVMDRRMLYGIKERAERHALRDDPRRALG